MNQLQVQNEVGFVDIETSPYPGSDDIAIDRSANCYVVFRDKARTMYDMVTSRGMPNMENERNFGVFLSHENPCGVCSSLVDLAVFLERRDLTNPVRLCGFASFVADGLNGGCLRDLIGFSPACEAIWLYNTQNPRDNCLSVCLWQLFCENNQPHSLGIFGDPCKPNTEADGGSCIKRINGGPACDEFQYEMGSPFRLNACLQCDECNSGPIFQKVAGRTRRGSGIESGIDRPDIVSINHNYFTEKGMRSRYANVTDDSDD